MSGICINTVFYSEEQLTQQEGCTQSELQRLFAEEYGKHSFYYELASFLADWQKESPFLTVKTSGSTGKPKLLQVEKQRMINSARLTVEFLGLQPGDSAQLCMPLQYIAGKMVVIRSLVAGLNLIPVSPSSHPLADIEESPVFSAMIPLQVSTSLVGEQKTKEGKTVSGKEAVAHGIEAQRLRNIRHLIIGGGSVDTALGQLLQDFPHQVWSTYGMTETLSHIALRKLNGKDASEWYTPFPSVEVSRSKEDTLVIYAPLVNAEHLVTNDRVEFNDQGQFRILGRKDNVINSGGVKLQIEEIEHSLVPKLPCPAVISSQKDERFGERVVLVLARSATNYGSSKEQAVVKEDSEMQELAHVRDLSQYFCRHHEEQLRQDQVQELCRIGEEEHLTLDKVEEALRFLPKYWQPKRVYLCDCLPQTATGKPKRAKTKELLQALV